MSTWQRFGVGLFWTLSLMVGGLIYNEVFAAELMPLIDPDGMFSTPVIWMDRLVPVILAGLLLFVWIWVVIGSVREERTVRQRRIR